MKRVIIMQGCSGSGKSFIAKSICDNHLHTEGTEICSADNFWYQDGTGKYNFEISRLGEAHRWCREEFLRLIKDGVKSIIVDNTNTTKKDAKFYIDEAKKHGYIVQVISIQISFEDAILQNNTRTSDRKIPEYVIENQRGKIEKLL